MNKAPALVVALLGIGLAIYAGFSSGSFWAGAIVFIVVQSFITPMFYPPPGDP